MLYDMMLNHFNIMNASRNKSNAKLNHLHGEKMDLCTFLHLPT